ncbi:unnamed protein product [Trichogramma brassicae]|uniref:Uncharacterized protein n=1 Tax=Trichogramma brassicae TaxID=86971 RepID=A0A6H5HZY1_9HYME|nr:unnamed protein product [Trichogramma brassicae]
MENKPFYYATPATSGRVGQTRAVLDLVREAQSVYPCYYISHFPRRPSLTMALAYWLLTVLFFQLKRPLRRLSASHRSLEGPGFGYKNFPNNDPRGVLACTRPSCRVKARTRGSFLRSERDTWGAIIAGVPHSLYRSRTPCRLQDRTTVRLTALVAGGRVRTAVLVGPRPVGTPQT